MPKDLQAKVERFVVGWLLEFLTRFNRDPRQAKEFEQAVTMLARIAFAGADGGEQCRAVRVEGLVAKAVHGRFQVPYAMGAAAARDVIQRHAITFGGTAEEYERQAEGLRRDVEQWRDEAQKRLERGERATP